MSATAISAILHTTVLAIVRFALIRISGFAPTHLLGSCSPHIFTVVITNTFFCRSTFDCLADFLYFFNQPAQVSQNQSARASSPRSGKYFSGKISFLRLLFISVPSIQYYEFTFERCASTEHLLSNERWSSESGGSPDQNQD